MINIKEIQFGLYTVDSFTWYIQTYVSDTQNGLDAIVKFYYSGNELKNWDNGFIGVKINIPQDVIDDWGTDDSYITEWICSQLGLTLA